MYNMNFIKAGTSHVRTGPKKKRFLLGTGRMPHPVGGAMGVALCTAVKIKGDKPASY